MKQVDANLFHSKADPNMAQLSVSQSTMPKQTGGAPAMGQTGISSSASTSRKQQYLQNLKSVGATIDDSEFYRSTNMVDNTKDTLVETNIRGVLEKHMETTKDHRPCKVPIQLYEKLPMMKEGIYLKDFKPQDLHMSKPHYGDANNPYENFIPQNPPATDDSLYRRDFTSKQLKNMGEPVIRDVISSQNDFAKHLKAPRPNDSLYKAEFPNWGVVPPPSSILPANPKTLASGMPFFGKSTASDYGNFMGIKDKPIKIYHNNQKSR